MAQQIVEFENSPHVVRLNLRDPSSITDRLAPGVYKIKIHPKLGILLPKVKPSYSLPPNVFGSKTTRAAQLIWSTFERREGIMGALVTGIKGSGKTLLVETVSNHAIAEGMPVFVVDDPDLDLDTLELIAKHCEPCVFLFDEFAKVYRDEKQENLLTFFSSTGFNKVLCLMTENEVRSVNTYLLNRPGRMLFHLRYVNVTVDEAKEVCQAFKVTAEITEEICKYVETAEVSMDILRTVCAEAARCKTVAEFKELFDVLNIPKMEFYNYTVQVNGDRDVQLDLQKRFEYLVKVISAGSLEVSRIDRETGETMVDIIRPQQDRTLVLRNWTRLQVDLEKSNIPAQIGIHLPIKWEYDLKEMEELRLKREQASGQPMIPPPWEKKKRSAMPLPEINVGEIKLQ